MFPCSRLGGHERNSLNALYIFAPAIKPASYGKVASFSRRFFTEGGRLSNGVSLRCLYISVCFFTQLAFTGVCFGTGVVLGQSRWLGGSQSSSDGGTRKCFVASLVLMLALSSLLFSGLSAKRRRNSMRGLKALAIVVSSSIPIVFLVQHEAHL